MKVKFGIAISEDLESWLSGAAATWNLSRSAVVELSVRTLRQLVEGLAVVTETRESRALAALRSFQAGEVPATVDLEAFARVLQKEEPEEAPR